MLILAGCSSSKKTADYDDVYYSTRQEKKMKKQQEMQTADPDYYVQNQDPTTDYYVEEYDAGEYVSYEEQPAYSETTQNPDGTTYITNNYYGSGGYGDYYDYNYSARINRFYNPYVGFNYYSPCYVGFYYDPWYSPYWYRPSFYMSFGWGWGYPHYYGYPYNNYWYGYNNGYYNGYWDGYYASNYYGLNSSGSYYYGPRTSGSSSSNNTSRSGANGYYAQAGKSSYTDRSRPLFNGTVTTTPASGSSGITGARNENTTLSTNGRNGQGNKQVSLQQTSGTTAEKPGVTPGRTGTNASIVAGSAAKRDVNATPQNEVSKNTAEQNKTRYTYKKPTSVQTSDKVRYQPGESISSPKRTQPAQRYAKPTEVNTNATRSDAQNRSTLYSKPKTNPSNSYSRPAQYNTSNRSAQPARSNSSYSQPSRSNTNSYSQPARSSSNTYSKPSNSGASRSSYSRPSNSGGNRSSTPSRSYSSPSRSGGSSSGTRSSSSGGSRGGRR